MNDDGFIADKCLRFLLTIDHEFSYAFVSKSRMKVNANLTIKILTQTYSNFADCW
jgi:hypothetical protein